MQVINKNTQELIPTMGYYSNHQKQTFSILLSAGIVLEPAVDYAININFTAPLSANLFGFYGSYYTDEHGKQM